MHQFLPQSTALSARKGGTSHQLCDNRYVISAILWKYLLMSYGRWLDMWADDIFAGIC